MLKKILGSKNLNSLANPFYQTLLMVFSVTIIGFLSHGYLKNFNNFDPSPRLLKNHNSAMPVVNTGLYVNNFSKFDMVKNDFEIDAVLWFEFDPKEITLEALGKCSFSKGSLSDEILLSQYSPYVEKRGNRVFARYNIKLNFVSNLNYSMFPIDAHRLYITLNNKHFNDELGRNVVLKVRDENFIVANEVYTPGWQVVNKAVRYGHVEDSLNNDQGINLNFPRVIFEIDFSNHSFKDIFLLIFPLLILFFMGLLTFAFISHREKGGQVRMRGLTLAASSISALVSYRFVIANLSPSADYFMFIDYIFNLILLCLFVIFIIQCLFLNKKFNYSGITLISFHVLFIASWTSFLYVWGI